MFVSLFDCYGKTLASVNVIAGRNGNAINPNITALGTIERRLFVCCVVFVRL
jgi:hypothetical protein